MLKIAWSSEYCHPLPQGHRFPMIKYDLIPQQLLRLGVIEPDNIFRPEAITEETILTTHDSDYWQKLKDLTLGPREMRRIGFPPSRGLVNREILICGGTLECCDYALKHGVSMNVAGGTHHAFADHGEGFCLLNDFAIAANELLRNRKAKRIMIVDLDVHQGNGTAALFSGNPRVFTFSMHGRHNYPLQKEASDLDIPLENNVTDNEYLSLLEETLPALIESHRADFIFYQCGVDVLATDKLGKLSLSRETCRKRDKIVLMNCRQKGIPVVAAMGGGYSERISDIVDAHCNTFITAMDVFY